MTLTGNPVSIVTSQLNSAFIIRLRLSSPEPSLLLLVFLTPSSELLQVSNSSSGNPSATTGSTTATSRRSAGRRPRSTGPGGRWVGRWRDTRCLEKGRGRSSSFSGMWGGGASVLFGRPGLVVSLPDAVDPRPLVGLVINFEDGGEVSVHGVPEISAGVHHVEQTVRSKHPQHLQENHPLHQPLGQRFHSFRRHLQIRGSTDSMNGGLTAKEKDNNGTDK